MYCPGCATQNLDDVKFCRACGTNLASVALALSDQTPNLSNRDAKTTRLSEKVRNQRRLAAKKFIEGGGLLAGSLVVGAALGLFSNQAEWIMIWLVFGGWMAVVGLLSIGKGIGSLVEAKYLHEQLEEIRNEPLEITSPSEIKNIAPANTSPTLTPISSVTEGTTELLGEAQNRNR